MPCGAWWQVHFGVNSGATNFAVERRAVNEATFRCPDELGWQPQVSILSPLISAISYDLTLVSFHLIPKIYFHLYSFVLELEWRATYFNSFSLLYAFPKRVWPSKEPPWNISFSNLHTTFEHALKTYRTWKVWYAKQPTPDQKSCWVRG